MENNFEDLNRGLAKLPNERTPFTMGILSGVLIIIGFCFGVFSLLTVLPAVVVSLIGVVKGSKSMKIYNANFGMFDPQSYYQVKAGRTISLVTLILSILFCCFNVFVLIGQATHHDVLSE